MYKISVSFFFILFSLFSSAQNSISLKGKIVNNESQLAVESATVYLTSSEDSTIIDYTISDRNGFFKLNLKKASQAVILKISSENYKEFSKQIGKITESKDLGILELAEYENILNEVVIKSDAPPIRIKKDTLEFNSSSFKMRPDANVEDLLKQLPGVVIDADKKITVNGKLVDKILVDGKSFFGEDGKIAIQNLPSEIINKIQVSDTKTKEEELTKQASSSNNSTINLTIEKDKSKGLFGKFMGGFGSTDRYESSALMSYFKDKRRISVLASSNNINATGFSMDEVFDNMGGGRGSGSRVAIGGGNGIIKSNLIGANYSDEWFKGFNSNGNYNYINSDSKNNNKTREATLLNTGYIRTESDAMTTVRSFDHNLDLNIEYKIDPTTNLYIAPKFSKKNTENSTDFNRSSWDDTNQLLNKNSSLNSNESDNINFENKIYFNKGFEKKGRYFTISLTNNNSRGDSKDLINSATLFYQGNNPDDIRNQTTKAVDKKDNFANSIGFIEPITDSLKLNFDLISKWDKLYNDKKTFDFNSSTGSYSDLNELLSNNTFSETTQISPKAGFTIGKKKFTLKVLVGTDFIKTENNSLYRNTSTDLVKNHVIPDATINANYSLSESEIFYLYYDRQFLIPTAYQILPIPDLSNPLNTNIGNPELSPSKLHLGNLGFENYDYASRSGYSLSLNGRYYDNQIVSTSNYQINGKQTTTYTNISGTYNTGLNLIWIKNMKNGAHKLGLNLGFNTNYNLDKGFTNTQLYTAKSIVFLPSIGISYEYGELLVIRPSYNFTYNNSKYTDYLVSSSSNKLHSFKIETTSYWPKKWIFGNDFGYSYNSNISDGFKKDFYLWNTSLSYNLHENDMYLKVKIYDVLNQNQSATRTITPTSIIDTENTVLKRYIMFSLSYKFQKFGTKEKPKDSGE